MGIEQWSLFRGMCKGLNIVWRALDFILDARLSDTAVGVLESDAGLLLAPSVNSLITSDFDFCRVNSASEAGDPVGLEMSCIASFA